MATISRPHAWAIVVAVAATGGAVGSERSDGQDPEGTERLRQALAAHPGRILHETWRDGSWEIFVRRADGSGARNLTSTPDVHEMYPQASPDGTKICFVVDGPVDGVKRRSVWWMAADGTGRRRVAVGARQPCWSPDGRRIAFLPSEFDRFRVTDYATKGIHFHDVRTGVTRPHPNPKLHHLYNPTWSRDGRWIVATVHGGMGYGHAILAIEVEGSAVWDLGLGGCRPDLSRDGTRIVWGKDDHTIGIAEIDFGGDRPRVSGVRDLVRDPRKHLYHADWSPCGRYVTFSRGKGGRFPTRGAGTSTGIAELVGVRADWNLCVVSATGGPWVPLTEDGESNKESEWIGSSSHASAAAR